MMKVKATVELNQDAIDTLIEAAQQAHKQATQAIADDILVSQVVPKDTGKLEGTMAVDTSTVADGSTSISFDTVYARRLYFNPQFNFHRDKNANAQGMWMQSYIDGDKAEMVRDEFAKSFKENAKGVIK
jgi:hypothetical protein